jgi:2-polyprenyl-3-methyl-5-hydroxy-6-metoxy-1,4-benzoquinol methylase
MTLAASLASYPALAQLAGGVLAAWPAHRPFLEKRFRDSTPAALAFGEAVAGRVLLLIDDLAEACGDYRWGGDLLFREELQFRRTGRYRRQTAAEVAREVYADGALMKRYFNGLLISQVLLPNHAAVLQTFVEEFLPGNAESYAHLEVGPGHGLMLHYAAGDPRCASVEAWEPSAEGLDATRRCLQKLGAGRPVKLLRKDVTVPPMRDAGPFTSVVASEVLEHLESPRAALRTLHDILEPGGRLFVNVPLSSPAPDHIYLFRHPCEIAGMVDEAGFRIERTHEFPQQGYTLERALAKAVTVSCVVIGVRR